MAPTKKQREILEALLFLREKGEVPTVREVGALVGLNSPATVMKHLRALEREGLITLSGKSRGIRIRAGAFPPRSPGAFPPRSPRGDGGGYGGGDVGASVGGGIPVVGRIAAGRPIEATPEVEAVDGESTGAASPVSSPLGPPEGTLAWWGAGGGTFPALSIDPRLFSGSGELMALRVAGESMIEAGILDGDYAIIRRQPVVEEGEIAAVDIEGEVTLKRWTASSSDSPSPSVRLIPANAGFAPIQITASDHKEVRILGKYVGLVRGEINLL